MTTPSDTTSLHEGCLDIAAIEDLARDIAWPYLAPIFARFAKETEERLPRMRTQCAAAAWDDLSREAHSLKGSAGHFGLPPLIAKARELETAAKAQDGEAAYRAMTELEPLAAHSLAVLGRYSESRVDGSPAV